MAELLVYVWLGLSVPVAALYVLGVISRPQLTLLWAALTLAIILDA